MEGEEGDEVDYEEDVPVHNEDEETDYRRRRRPQSEMPLPTNGGVSATTTTTTTSRNSSSSTNNNYNRTVMPSNLNPSATPYVPQYNSNLGNAQMPYGNTNATRASNAPAAPTPIVPSIPTSWAAFTAPPAPAPQVTTVSHHYAPTTAPSASAPAAAANDSAGWGKFNTDHGNKRSAHEVGGDGKRARLEASTSASSATILVTNIPDELNRVVNLSGHFEQFGRVVNVAVDLAGKSARVEFASPEEARKAVESPSAVMDNRFIQVAALTTGGGGAPSSQQQQQQHKKYENPSARPHPSLAPPPVTKAAVAEMMKKKSYVREGVETTANSGAALAVAARKEAAIKAAKVEKAAVALRLAEAKLGMERKRLEQARGTAAQLKEQLNAAKRMSPEEKDALMVQMRSLVEQIRAGTEAVAKAEEDWKVAKRNKAEVTGSAATTTAARSAEATATSVERGNGKEEAVAAVESSSTAGEGEGATSEDNKTPPAPAAEPTAAQAE